MENFNIPSLVELVEDNNNNNTIRQPSRTTTLLTTYAYIWSPILKVGGAATSYVVTLYIDVHRQRLRPSTTTPTRKGREARRVTTERRRRKRIPFRSVYLPQVGWAFLRILPAYPFLAVVISFLFLFVVDIWDYIFHLPVEYWNKPIYYGTLYGPFAYTCTLPWCIIYYVLYSITSFIYIHRFDDWTRLDSTWRLTLVSFRFVYSISFYSLWIMISTILEKQFRNNIFLWKE